MDLTRKTLYKNRLLLNSTDLLDEIIYLNTCCLSKGNFPLEFRKHRNLYFPELGVRIMQGLETFQKEAYLQINPQNAILPSFTLGIQEAHIDDLQSTNLCIKKIDMDFAYITALKTIQLPAGQKHNFVGQDAIEAFDKIRNFNFFGFIRVFVSFRAGRIPFIPSKFNDRKYIYTVCRTCSNENTLETILKECSKNHTFDQRKLIFTLYLKDFEYILSKDLIDRFEIVQLSYYDALTYCPKLKILSNIIFNMKKHGNLLEKSLLKPMSLSGLGRFALDVSKQNTSKANLYLSCEEIELALQRNRLQSLIKSNDIYYGVERAMEL